jgi:hypothetical protein
VACHATIFYSEGIQKLVSRWTKCVAKEGDYVEQEVLERTNLLLSLQDLTMLYE